MKYKTKEEFEKVDSFGVGAPNDAFAQYFQGQSFLKPLTEFGKCPVFLANVTFEPGCRNNWHIHHAKSGGGQLLICTAGEGWYQEEGKAAVSLTPGTVITIPAEVKHWHGAKADSSLKYHLENAKKSGVTQKEIATIITHCAFYVGWPKGWAVFNMAKEIWTVEK